MNAIVNFVTTIPIANIHPFEDNPYKVQDNEEMQFLCESIRENGVLSPLLVRKSCFKTNSLRHWTFSRFCPKKSQISKISAERLQAVLPQGLNAAETEDYAIKACEHYRKFQRRREQER